MKVGLFMNDKPKINRVESQLLSQLWQLRRNTRVFTGNDVDHFFITNRHGNRMRPETTSRRLRELNNRFNLFVCFTPSESRYEFIVNQYEIKNLIDKHDVFIPSTRRK